MYLQTLEICVLNYNELDPVRFLTAPGLARQADIKKGKVKLDLLIDVDMLLLLLPQMFIQNCQFKICNMHKFCFSIRSCNNHEYNKGGCVCSNRYHTLLYPWLLGRG